MSIQDERDLRARLGGLLDTIDPAPVPAARVMKRGRVIRMRRWLSAAAGVAVLAAGAVVLPGLIQGDGAAGPMASKHYQVTVQNLGSTAKGGVVGVGTINNKRWRVVLDKPMGDGCSPQPYLLICGSTYDVPAGPREVNLSASGGGSTQFQLGTVGADVTRVVMRLSNGSALNLWPVSAYGRRWVAVAAPSGAMVEAESFVGRTEYRYAVPNVTDGFAQFATWLRPGQPGLPRAFASVGSGSVDGVAWQASVKIGPWGYCSSAAGGGDCVGAVTPPAIGKPLVQFACAVLYTASTTKQVGAASVVVLPRGVKNLVLRFADGSQLRLVATYVGGTRALGFGLPVRPRVVSADEFGFAGQFLGTTSALWRC
jgi:hypothetical protein